VHHEDNKMETLHDERVIEMFEIPAGTKLNMLIMILESQRHTGVADVRVETLEFLTDDPSRALVTLCTAQSILITVFMLLNTFLEKYDILVICIHTLWHFCNSMN